MNLNDFEIFLLIAIVALTWLKMLLHWHYFKLVNYYVEEKDVWDYIDAEESLTGVFAKLMKFAFPILFIEILDSDDYEFAKARKRLWATIICQWIVLILFVVSIGPRLMAFL